MIKPLLKKDGGQRKDFTRQARQNPSRDHVTRSEATPSKLQHTAIPHRCLVNTSQVLDTEMGPSIFASFNEVGALIRVFQLNKY
jgi:hypothetical protein